MQCGHRNPLFGLVSSEDSLINKTLVLFLSFFSTLQAPLKACVVCFGQSGDLNISRAYFWGIVLMLACTAVLLTAIGIVVYRIEVGRRTPHQSP